MMTSMKRKIAAMLAAVTLMTIGASAAMADYGDKDYGDKPRYKVGQYVEVYNTALHVTTTRHKVLSAEKDQNGRWNYKVDKSKFSVDTCYIPHYSSTSTVTAQDIES